jgi:hypothetical protein
MKKSKIIIFTPEYREWTGGIIVLHKLGSILQSLGWPVAFAPHGSNEFWSPYEIPVASYTSKDSIVVYPESAQGNPLGASKIVSYYLGKANPRGGFQLFYSKKWASINGQPNADVLFLSDSKKEIFKDKGEKRIGDCFTCRKNKQPDFIHHPGAFEIPRGMRNERLAEVFNSHERFICYDFNSFLNFQAALCGCDSIVAEEPGKTKEFFASGFPDGKAYGIAYGEEDIGRANLTRFKLRDYFNAIEQAQVERTRVMFEKIERNFNDRV